MVTHVDDFSEACGIYDTEDNIFIVTGGTEGGTETKRVTKYARNGVYQDDMPMLNTERRNHACESYTNSNLQKVCEI